MVLVLLSPSKKLELETPIPSFAQNQAEQSSFYAKTLTLVERMQAYDIAGLQKLMGVSEKIAALNVERYQSFAHSMPRVAIYTFSGDTYTGFQAQNLGAKGFAFAHQHIRILSGLYGLLKPSDLIKPYRLEMGTSFKKGDDLYQFWREDVTNALKADLQTQASNVIVNLASREYANVVDGSSLRKDGVDMIDFVFKDKVKSGIKVVGLLAKRARGLFARTIVDAHINSRETLQTLQNQPIGGYAYSQAESTQSSWVFIRDGG